MKIRNIIRTSPLAVLLAVLCLFFLAEPIDGKVRKKKAKRVAKTEQLQQPNLVADTLISDTLTADSLLDDTLVDTLATDTLPWPESLRTRIDTIIAKSDLLKTSQYGLMVYDLTADSLLYAANEKQTLRPASTMKLLTAITALDKLGGSYQYKTYLRYTGEVIDSTHTLNGNVYVVGGMDPRLNRDDLLAFVETLKKMGIDTICGNVCADRSFKDSLLLGEGWCWDDENPVLSPVVYAEKDDLLEHFVTEIYEDSIALKGAITDAVAPDSARDICMREHSIDQILTRMMKMSDNQYAESMYYQLAAAHSKPATADGAKAEERALIEKMGLDPSDYRLADGSGLSLYNYLTVELEVALLKYAYHNSVIYNHLNPSLPLAAYDGTLRKRMRGTKAAFNVRAKTGTVTGISSLAGYAKASNGHMLAFSIINQGILSSAPAKKFQDKICIAMCK